MYYVYLKKCPFTHSNIAWSDFRYSYRADISIATCTFAYTLRCIVGHLYGRQILTSNVGPRACRSIWLTFKSVYIGLTFSAPCLIIRGLRDEVCRKQCSVNRAADTLAQCRLNVGRPSRCSQYCYRKKRNTLHLTYIQSRYLDLCYFNTWSTSDAYIWHIKK